MKLNHLTDKTLLKDTKTLVSQERECITSILQHLKEIEARRLFADLKYGSLFEYSMKELGYSEAAANRRIHSARLLRDLPEIEIKFETGELNLTTATMASQFFKSEDIKDKNKKRDILNRIGKKSKRETQTELLSLATKKPDIKEKLKQVDVDKFSLTITVSEETLEKFENLKRLLGHQKLNHDGLMNFMIEVATKEAEKRKGKLTDKPKTAPAQSPLRRYVSAELKRRVFLRAKGKCQNCGSNYKLEYDHVLAYALGGTTEEKNLRLMCFSCNQRQRMRMGLVINPADTT